MELNTIHDRIKFVIDISKYSNNDISRLLKTSASNIYKLTNGDTKSPGYERIKELCDLLNVNPNFLFGYSKVPFRNTYADAIVDYMSPLSERDQRIIMRNVRDLKRNMEEEDIEFGKGPIKAIIR